jgi:hypothetical protein
MNGMRLKSRFVCVRFEILVKVTEDSCHPGCDAEGHEILDCTNHQVDRLG